MAREDFETEKEHPKREPHRLPSGFFARYSPSSWFALSFALLAGGAYSSSRVSESAPKTVYNTSLEEARAKARTPLLVDINTADAKEIDELPGVGPSAAEKIVEYRRHHGKLKSVNDPASVQKYEKTKSCG
ncbi:MAG TPA: helix-hairpin-helix domain-containing protein, partial [Rubrobacteraceae bacterium]|nr:helix-hairpin-helix domain-containing protein [Rubrobacteraceae bacterium]